MKNSYVLQYYGFNDVKECSRLSASVYGNSMLCVGNPVRRVEIRNVQPSTLRYTNLRIYGDTGKSDEVYFMPIDFDGWVIPVVTNHVSFISPCQKNITLIFYFYYVDIIFDLNRAIDLSGKMQASRHSTLNSN